MRRVDSNWRDGLLAVRHSYWGYESPAPGMKLPMIEYDRGEPLAVINYLSRFQALPRGDDATKAYHAFGLFHRETGEQLPFFTAQYDPRNWAFRLFPHNPAARAFLDTNSWVTMTEVQFVNNLYRLRGRYAPDLAAYGVDFGTDGWIETEPSPDFAPAEKWTGQLMSARRRNYEPVTQVRMSWRNPCVDIDFAVLDQDDRVALLVDYKAPGARVGLGSTNMQALSSLYVTSRNYRSAIPAMVVCYEPVKPSWTLRAHCLNHAARMHLSYVLDAGDDMDRLAETIAGTEWVDLSESQWKDVLNVARDL